MERPVRNTLSSGEKITDVVGNMLWRSPKILTGVFGLRKSQTLRVSSPPLETMVKRSLCEMTEDVSDKAACASRMTWLAAVERDLEFQV
jgi:hypothetical protein